ncbi:MAG TPA: tetratricopeptide repeat protein [Alphaproteobacteria bacterium]|nr:tetratricopeptide repeat protein [Alphaproteobacteria bacterium]
MLLAGTAAFALSACATSPMTTGSIGGPDLSAATPTQRSTLLGQLAQRYKQNPADRTTLIAYSGALRANGQAGQAIAVIEAGMPNGTKDPGILLAYAKALAAAGRFEQALNILDDAIDPAAPDWNALMVKGAILDQSGRNEEARLIYGQALKIAPNEPSLHATLGLSYAMTNDLGQAEAELRTAAGLPGASSQIRQNLALIVGLEGRFDEAQKLLAAVLPPDQVAANMAYIKSLITQQNRWDLIRKEG